MFIVAGLGNPGEPYRGTRHNIGFHVADRLAGRFNGSWKKGKGAYDLCQILDGDRKIALVKPLTYMNLSGQAVKSVLDWFEAPLENLLVVTDDIHLETGVLRLRKEGSAGGHNGLADITKVLGSQAFARLRFGVGNRFHPGTQADYVLGRFAKTEHDDVETGTERAADCVLSFCKDGIDVAMNRFNTKTTPISKS